MDYNSVEILFVEDNIHDATLTLHALKKSGLSNVILHVKDGTEALNFMYCKEAYSSRNIRQPIKLILLDLKMPKVSGIDVLTKLKSDPIFKSYPVVILTSSEDDPDINKCYELGANSYILKPVEGDNFFQVIKELSLYWMISNKPPLECQKN